MTIKEKNQFIQNTKQSLQIIMTLYSQFQELANNEWEFQQTLQAYHDCLITFKKNNIIKNYNLQTKEINYV
jgi:hypothetical protein